MAMALYPPYMDPYTNSLQQRYDQLARQYPQFSGQTHQPRVNVTCVPVASLDEARAVATDFSGGLTIMPDIAHGAVYTKQLNQMDGTVQFFTYFREQPAAVPAPVPVSPEAGTAASMEYAPLSIVEELKQEIAHLKELIAQPAPAAKPSGRGGDRQ